MSRDVPTLWEREADEPTWSVGELAGALEAALRHAFPEEVWLRGQIRNLSRGRRMVWFDLVEPGADDAAGGGDAAASAGAPGSATQATVPVVLFDLPRRHVNARLRLAGGAVRMEDGTEVRLRGRVTWWRPGGRLQVAMSDIDPEFTLGRLAMERERLLQQLETEGLLRAQARLAWPEVPLRLGLVTSAGSAAEHDVLDELRRSGIGFQVMRADVRVQGRDAPGEIARALRAVAARGVELVLLVRGGGAATDLAAFDSETIARAIARLEVPVVTGVGHEVDRSVADEVAHTAYKTPTASAQAVVGLVRDFVQRLEGTAGQISVALRRGLRAADRDLAHRTNRLAGLAEVSLTRSVHQIDRASGRAQAGARVHLSAEARRLDSLHQRLALRAPAAADSQLRRLAGAEVQLRALDPQRALARGWSITQTADGTLVRSPGDVTGGDELVTTTEGGQLRSTVRP